MKLEKVKPGINKDDSKKECSADIATYKGVRPIQIPLAIHRGEGKLLKLCV